MANWVIGDVHGCFEPLMRLLQKIHFDRTVDKLYFLGDLIDRGPNMQEVLDFVWKGQEEGWAETIIGNHEDMWIQAVDGAGMYIHSFEQHSSSYPHTEAQLGRSGIEKMVEWARTLPVAIVMEDVILVHGGMESFKPFTHHTRDQLLWTRSHEEIPGEFRDWKTIIHGHTPIQKPLIRRDRCNIDTSCVFGGALTALLIDDFSVNSTIRYMSVGRDTQ